MINYKTEEFIAEGERVAVRGSTAWQNRKTKRVVDTPKADFWTFRDGKVTEFHEFYDTAALIDGDAPVLLGEHRHLLPPAQMIAAGAVQEEHRGPVATGVFVVETISVVVHERHRAVSSSADASRRAPRLDRLRAAG